MFEQISVRHFTTLTQFNFLRITIAILEKIFELLDNMVIKNFSELFFHYIYYLMLQFAVNIFRNNFYCTLIFGFLSYNIMNIRTLRVVLYSSYCRTGYKGI
jgi:hypothetical protein